MTTVNALRFEWDATKAASKQRKQYEVYEDA